MGGGGGEGAVMATTGGGWGGGSAWRRGAPAALVSGRTALPAPGRAGGAPTVGRGQRGGRGEGLRLLVGGGGLPVIGEHWGSAVRWAVGREHQEAHSEGLPLLWWGAPVCGGAPTCSWWGAPPIHGGGLLLWWGAPLVHGEGLLLLWWGLLLFKGGGSSCLLMVAGSSYSW